MANLEVLALDTATPQIRAPGAGDGYSVPRDITLSNNLIFGSTAQRITGDMSNATTGSRLAFQTSTTNAQTIITVAPNGTAYSSLLSLEGDSSLTNGSIFQFHNDHPIGRDNRITAGIRGTGTYTPMTFYTGGSERMRLDTSGNVGIGASSFLGKLNVTGSSSALLSDQTSAYAPSANSNSTSVILQNESLTTGAYTSLEFWARNAANNLNIAYIASPSTSTNNSGTLVFGRRTGGGTSAESMRIDSSGNVGIGTASPGSKLDVNGIIRDSAGNLRAIPPVGTKTGSYTLATGDVGKYVQVGSGGSITIPDATFAEGDVISIFNNTSGAITITCTITTAYIAGTDADKATVSLATRGVATILFISGTVCVISGNVT